MKKSFIKLAYGAFLGGSLALFANVHWYDWKFYAIVIPTILLAEMKVYHTNEDE
jgi:hypothetical protein